ncbi:MAG: DUF1844 domain-containing protein [Polyangiaceae bacterium]
MSKPNSPNSSGAPSDEHPDLSHITFGIFVASLRDSALVDLGQAPHSDGTISKNLPLARQTLDILALLEEKTHGNLTGPEEHLLTQVLLDLRERLEEASRTG